eukprot:SAG31_NODE_5223_length_2665_cov_1.982853_3_plen_231_part_00
MHALLIVIATATNRLQETTRPTPPPTPTQPTISPSTSSPTTSTTPPPRTPTTPPPPPQDACVIDPHRCRNGGQCSNLPQGRFYCSCTVSFTGTTCETAKPSCQSASIASSGLTLSPQTPTYSAGARINVACISGYQLSQGSPQAISCQQDGHFSARPRCIVAPPPPPPPTPSATAGSSGARWWWLVSAIVVIGLVGFVAVKTTGCQRKYTRKRRSSMEATLSIYDDADKL